MRFNHFLNQLFFTHNAVFRQRRALADDRAGRDGNFVVPYDNRSAWLYSRFAWHFNNIVILLCSTNVSSGNAELSLFALCSIIYLAVTVYIIMLS